MMLKRLTVAAAFAAVALAIIAAGAASAMAQGQQNGGPPAPGGTQAANGPTPGEAVVSWQAVASATHYRVGWVAYDDYNAAIAAGRDWLEAFTFVDLANRGQTSHQIARLTPGINYAFIVGSSASRYAAPTWSDWASLTLIAAPGTTSCPTSTPAANVDYDTDDDGLIEIASLAQLDVIRHDLDGDGVSAHADHAAAFPNALDGMGCPGPFVCNGYELTADLDFDTNGNNRPDAGDAYWDGGHGWLPIGDEVNQFTAVLDGNNHTIANLYINRSDGNSVGLFGYALYSSIKQVGIVSAAVSGSGYAGGLVGNSGGSTISDSYATGSVSGGGRVGGLIGDSGNSTISDSYAIGNVSGSVHIGGLVGYSGSSTISDSYATGSVSGGGHVGGLVGSLRRNGSTVSGSYATGSVFGTGNVFGGNNVGGLVGLSSGTINSSYATVSVLGSGFVGGLVGQNVDGTIGGSYATGNVSGDSIVGGLVGDSTGTVSDSYATGSVSGDDYVGGLVGGSGGGTVSGSYAIGDVSSNGDSGGLIGYYEGGAITASYWDTQTTGQSGSYGGIGKTTAELQAPTENAGIYANWSPDYWDFGTDSQYPVLKYGGLNVAAQRS